MSRSHKARQQYAIARRRAIVTDLYLKGKRISMIAEELGVTPSTISKDLTDMREQWRAEAVTDYNTKILDELARLQRVEEKAWEGWQRSFDDCTTRTTKTKCYKEPIKGKKDKFRLIPFEEVTDESIKGQSGNPLFLQQIERCVTLRLKLMGALDPDVTQNVNVIQINWADMMKKPKDEETDPLQDALKELRERTSPPALPAPGQFISEENNEQVVIESTAHVKENLP